MASSKVDEMGAIITPQHIAAMTVTMQTDLPVFRSASGRRASTASMISAADSKVSGFEVMRGMNPASIR